jgi:hypothetical protein
MLHDRSYPQFICPNCRAITDLEADVDMPENGEVWEEAEEPVDAEIPVPNPDTVMMNDEGTAVTVVARDAGNPSNPGAANGNIIMSIVPEASAGNQQEASRPNASTSNLMSRRQASNVSWLRTGAGVTSIDMPELIAPANAHDPSTSTDETDETSPEENRHPLRSPTPLPNEQISTDGLLTPTNNAGPFVFDGRAGRASGRRLIVSAEDLSE